MKKLFTTLSVLLVAAATMAQVPSYVPTNGLVGWWPFNGNANDESGNGNNGTVNGATLTTDRFGNTDAAYDFDGVNDYVEASHLNQLDAAQQLSISVWVEAQTVGGFSKFVSQENSGSCGVAVQFAGDANFGCRTRNNNFGVGNTNLSELNTGEWYHLVMIYDGTQSTNANKLQLYVGDDQTSLLYPFDSIPNELCTTASQLYFGKLIGGSDSWYHGKLDDIGIWNRALTEEEITGLYNGQCVAPTQVSLTGLNSSYNLNDGTAQLSASPGGGVFFGAGVSGNTFSPASAGVGTHSVVYTYVDSDGCVASTGLCTTVDLNVNIGDSNIGTDGSIDVYPNPSNGQFVLEIQDLEGIISCTVYDTRGREVYYGSMVASGSTIRHSIDLSNETNGIYTLQMQTPTGTVTRKLVKE